MVGCNSKLKAANRDCAVFEAPEVTACQEKKKEKAAHCFKSYFLVVVVLYL